MVKIPTLRQWGKKLAVAVDSPFFEAIGGKTRHQSQVWLVMAVSDDFKLQPRHWEVLPLEVSANKLLAADRGKREEFEAALRGKLRRFRDRLMKSKQPEKEWMMEEPKMSARWAVKTPSSEPRSLPTRQVLTVLDACICPGKTEVL